MSESKAILLRTGEVKLRIGTWSERFPVDLLPSRIALYKDLAERKSGRYAKHYQPTLDVLLDVQRRHSGPK